jgi:hypothetical protein
LGVVLSIISYFIVHYFYEKEKTKRLTRSRNKHAICTSKFDKNFI